MAPFTCCPAARQTFYPALSPAKTLEAVSANEVSRPTLREREGRGENRFGGALNGAGERGGSCRAGRDGHPHAATPA
ncbi:MAG: hypothetical protein ACKO3P_24600, partial [Planctomycetaceae bacterium]